MLRINISDCCIKLQNQYYLPLEIGNITSVIDLYLYHNQLTGEIPPEVCDLIESNNLNIFWILEGNNLINTCE